MQFVTSCARGEGLSAKQIVRHHTASSRSRAGISAVVLGTGLARGEAPKRSHVAACQSFFQLARVWNGLLLQAPVEFRDLTNQPMPKSHSRWGRHAAPAD